MSGDVPSGTGRLCEWREDPQQPADKFSSFGAYQVNTISLIVNIICNQLFVYIFLFMFFQRSLTLDCQEGQPGIIQWTPDRNTPDLVYYQCYTHRYLGWKINVVDSCDQ